MFRKQAHGHSFVKCSKKSSPTHSRQNLAMQGLQSAPSQPQEMGEEIRGVFLMHKRMRVIFHTQAALRRESNKILGNQRKYFKGEKAKIHNHRVQQMKPTCTSPQRSQLLLALCVLAVCRSSRQRTHPASSRRTGHPQPASLCLVSPVRV